MSKKLFALKLLKSFDRYNAGEVAGFEDAVARQLIAQGIAKEFSEEEEAAELAAKMAHEDALTKRADDLDAREASLAAREAALSQAAIAGDPPAQGGGKK